MEATETSAKGRIADGSTTTEWTDDERTTVRAAVRQG